MRRRQRTNHRVSTPKQRRRQQLLEVEARAERRAAHRMQWGITALCTLFLVVSAAGGLWWGVRELINRFFIHNPEYDLAEIQLTVEGSMTREQVLRETGVHEGVNLFSIKLGEVHRRLQALPQVREVEVQRELPNKLAIKIVERVPVAWIAPAPRKGEDEVSDRSLLIDATGMVLSSNGQHYKELPTIYGASAEDLKAGRPADSFAVKAALELIRLNTQALTPMRFQAVSVDVSKGHWMTVLDENHVQAVFKLDDLASQFQRLETVLVYCEKDHHELRTIDLRPARNIVARFAEEPAPAPTPSPTPTKKNSSPPARPEIRKAQPVPPGKPRNG